MDTRGVFLDISQAFDKVWHDGLIFKLRSFGISVPLLSLIRDSLSERFQKVVLNGQVSGWKYVEADVPQGPTLGPLFFFYYYY